MTTRQPGGRSLQGQAADQHAKAAGRERNTIGQTESQTSYWREQYQSEPYYSQGESFDQYEPAYRTGIEGRSQYAGQRFEDVEDSLRTDYESNRGASTKQWDQGANRACRAAWDRADQSTASSSDSDRQSRR